MLRTNGSRERKRASTITFRSRIEGVCEVTQIIAATRSEGKIAPTRARTAEKIGIS